MIYYWELVLRDYWRYHYRASDMNFDIEKSEVIFADKVEAEW